MLKNSTRNKIPKTIFTKISPKKRNTVKPINSRAINNITTCKSNIRTTEWVIQRASIRAYTYNGLSYRYLSRGHLEARSSPHNGGLLACITLSRGNNSIHHRCRLLSWPSLRRVIIEPAVFPLKLTTLWCDIIAMHLRLLGYTNTWLNAS